MSIKVSTMVWEKWPNGGSEMLCLLALADWCNDEGGSLYPSIGALAKKMRVSDRQAQRVLHSLIDRGFVSVVGNTNGGAPGTTRQYHLNVKRLQSLPDYSETGDIAVTPDVNDTGDTGDADGCHGCRETGDIGVTQTVIEPLVEPLAAPKPKGATRKHSIPNDFKPNETCRSRAIQSNVSMEIELEKFSDYHLAKGSKFKDWQAAFRNWLTKAGEYQAQRGGNVAQFPRRPATHSDDSGSKVYIPEAPQESYEEYLQRLAAEGQS
ncbi:helix-turn-helix domain-containing protein [Halomonas salifodinae]|uniref:Helix-turn-helix domain-containing protein n=1 Tax=Halomonas salifodinae TaxID=438745 RepID=A0ABW2F4M8_9GAMM